MNRLLEEYLNDVNKGLRATPTSYRTENIEELRQHLESLAAQQEIEGVASDAALAVAINEFGAPTKVARQLTTTWWRGRLQKWGRSTPVTIVALSLMFRYALFLPVSFLYWLYPTLLHDPAFNLSLYWLWPASFSFAVGFLQMRRALVTLPATLLIRIGFVGSGFYFTPLLHNWLLSFADTLYGITPAFPPGYWHYVIPFLVTEGVYMLLGFVCAGMGILCRSGLMQRRVRAQAKVDDYAH